MANIKEGKLLQDKQQIILSELLIDDDNQNCFECDAKGPLWASWNLGIFLCNRCAIIHRNLGDHLSRVKSVNFDSWTPQEVAMMKQIGNSRGRAIYEANLDDNFRRPQTDTTLEQFIRAKYEHKRYFAKEWIPPNTSADVIANDIRKLEHNMHKKRTTNISNNSASMMARKDTDPQIPRPQTTDNTPVNNSNKVDLLGLDNVIGDDTFGDFDFACDPTTVAASSSPSTLSSTSAVDDLMGLNLDDGGYMVAQHTMGYSGPNLHNSSSMVVAGEGQSMTSGTQHNPFFNGPSSSTSSPSSIFPSQYHQTTDNKPVNNSNKVDLLGLDNVIGDDTFGDFVFACDPTTVAASSSPSTLSSSSTMATSGMISVSNQVWPGIGVPNYQVSAMTQPSASTDMHHFYAGNNGPLQWTSNNGQMQLQQQSKASFGTQHNQFFNGPSSSTSSPSSIFPSQYHQDKDVSEIDENDPELLAELNDMPGDSEKESAPMKESMEEAKVEMAATKTLLSLPGSNGWFRQFHQKQDQLDAFDLDNEAEEAIPVAPPVQVDLAKVPAKQILDQLLQLIRQRAQLSKIKPLLETLGDINVILPNKFSILGYACARNHIPLVKHILQTKGVNINHRSIEESSPLIIAIQFNCFDIVKLLLQHKCDVDLGDIEGNSPLLWSVKLSNFRMVHELIKSYCNFERPNYACQTWEDMPNIENESFEIFEMLSIHSRREICQENRRTQVFDDNKVVVKLICYICKVTECNAFIDCGHIFCYACIQSRTICPHCSLTIKNVRRLYN